MVKPPGEVGRSWAFVLKKSHFLCEFAVLGAGGLHPVLQYHGLNQLDEPLMNFIGGKKEISKNTAQQATYC